MLWEWEWEGCSRHKDGNGRDLAVFPFPVIVDSVYCLTFLKVFSEPQDVQKQAFHGRDYVK